MIRDVLIPELERRFGAGSSRIGESPVVVFPAKHRDVGDVQIWDDSDEVTLGVGDITHGHFNPYDRTLSQDEIDRKVTQVVTEFLHALFSDRVLLWKSRSGHTGGWARLDLGEEDDEHDVISHIEKDAVCFVWSGPRGIGR